MPSNTSLPILSIKSSLKISRGFVELFPLKKFLFRTSSAVYEFPGSNCPYSSRFSPVSWNLQNKIKPIYVEYFNHLIFFKFCILCVYFLNTSLKIHRHFVPEKNFPVVFRFKSSKMISKPLAVAHCLFFCHQHLFGPDKPLPSEFFSSEEVQILRIKRHIFIISALTYN